jgi:hypothetical protein
MSSLNIKTLVHVEQNRLSVQSLKSENADSPFLGLMGGIVAMEEEAHPILTLCLPVFSTIRHADGPISLSYPQF